MRLIPIATALALTLSATMAVSQDVNTEEMKEGLTMLERAATDAFRKYDISADPQTLTLAQLGEIYGVLNASDQMDVGNQKAKIEAALRRN